MEPRFRPAQYKVDHLELYQPFFYQTISSEDEVFEHHERIFHKLHKKVLIQLDYYFIHFFENLNFLFKFLIFTKSI